MTRVLLKKEKFGHRHRNTKRRIPYEHTQTEGEHHCGRDWLMHLQPRKAKDCWLGGGNKGLLPIEPSEKTWPFQYLYSDF